MRCGTCHFWSPINETQGDCRAKSPGAFPYVEYRTNEKFVRAWPVTAFTEWCGEYHACLEVAEEAKTKVVVDAILGGTAA